VLTDPIFTHLGESVLLLAPDSTVLDLTAAARATLGHGLVLRLDRGRLACVAARGTTLLRRHVLALAYAGDPFRVVTLALPRVDGSPPALARFSALPNPPRVRGGVEAPPVVLVRVAEPEARAPVEAGDLQALFGLTRAEAHVARRVLDTDGGLPRVASQLGVSLTTARTHLQRVFEKTRTRRQSQLVRLLLSYSAPCADVPTPADPRPAAQPRRPAAASVAAASCSG
jgi:DNA-binding CsgD family transcriptional regulator